MPASRTLTLVGTALLAVPFFAACGGSSDEKGSPSTVAITATDSTCEVARTALPAGETTFAVTNKGSKVTEVYVYGERDGAYTKVISEVENIGPGTSRDMQVQLTGGTYEVACKPGQRGDGIRQKITVAGGQGAEHEAEGRYDREVKVTAKDFTLTGLDGFTGKIGEKIEFKLENAGTVDHELEIFSPDGKEIGEVSPVKPGATDEAVITLPTAGTYTYKCGIDGHADHGMTGSFTVQG
ncbi:hypothetical protein FDG2_3412 [Candidatus Protofrankia californiensis]|uniref:EfeO-type cupredoxin-like domain-containing protein n=1 Tax=Candidatus Protofrankia californiensis TaxID=1839754 RepID=A0A1C3NZL3_9ACTN|nr:hypothetical protein FDG2_3412 [Candidatus Protofrankia californiensis]